MQLTNENQNKQAKKKDQTKKNWPIHTIMDKKQSQATKSHAITSYGKLMNKVVINHKSIGGEM